MLQDLQYQVLSIQANKLKEQVFNNIMKNMKDSNSKKNNNNSNKCSLEFLCYLLM